MIVYKIPDGRSFLLHVLVEASYMNSHWCTHYIQGITAQAKRKAIDVVIHTHFDFITNGDFDDMSVILLGSSLTWTKSAVDYLYAHDVHPIVLAGANYQKLFPFASFITMDYEDATRKLMLFLRARSKKKTAFFSGNSRSATDMQKVTNFLQSGGQEADVFNYSGSLKATGDRLLARMDEFDSVLCANDVSAVLLAKRLQSLGYRLPSDIHLATFGDTILQSLEIHNIAVARVKSQEAGKLALSAYRLLKSNPSVSSMSLLLHCDILDYNYEPTDIKLPHKDPVFDRNQPPQNFFRDPDVEKVILVEKLLSGCDKLDVSILREILIKESYSKIAEKYYIAENTISYRIKKILAAAPDKSKEEVFSLLSEFLL